MTTSGSSPRFIVAGTHSSAGKTSWTLGLLAALRHSGFAVQPFKAGPDYIDPQLHSTVAGRVSRNLDTRLMGPSCIRRVFLRGAEGADISVIEGVMGYFDGSLEERSGGLAAGCTAELARTLPAPVLLVLDVHGASDSAAATARGFVNCARPNRIEGFLLNRVGSERHASAVRRAVERSTGLPVLGCLPRRSGLSLPERHLGLVGPDELPGFQRCVDNLRYAVLAGTDIDALRTIARRAPAVHAAEPRVPRRVPSPRVRIAVSRDEAFNFLYEDNIDVLRGLGADVVFFSPLHDPQLPRDIHGLYLCGGYPELHLPAIECNRGMRESIRAAAAAGLPTYAECGGYMYLLEAIVLSDGTSGPGLGILPGRAVMTGGLRMMGYFRGVVTDNSILGPRGTSFVGHVFHWSRIEGAERGQRPALMLHGTQEPPIPDGVLTANLFASYLHLHFAASPSAARWFVASCVRFRRTARHPAPVPPA